MDATLKNETIRQKESGSDLAIQTVAPFDDKTKGFSFFVFFLRVFFLLLIHYDADIFID